MTRDRKEVFSEAYYAALEDGASAEAAERAGTEAMQDHEERLQDQADMLRKERSEG